MKQFHVFSCLFMSFHVPVFLRELEDMKLRHVQEEQNCLEKQRTKKAWNNRVVLDTNGNGDGNCHRENGKVGAVEKSLSDSTKAEAVKSRMKDMEAKALQGLGNSGLSNSSVGSNGFPKKPVHVNGHVSNSKS